MSSRRVRTAMPRLTQKSSLCCLSCATLEVLSCAPSNKVGVCRLARGERWEKQKLGFVRESVWFMGFSFDLVWRSREGEKFGGRKAIAFFVILQFGVSVQLLMWKALEIEKEGWFCVLRIVLGVLCVVCIAGWNRISIWFLALIYEWFWTWPWICLLFWLESAWKWTRWKTQNLWLLHSFPPSTLLYFFDIKYMEKYLLAMEPLCSPTSTSALLASKNLIFNLFFLFNFQLNPYSFNMEKWNPKLWACLVFDLNPAF